MIRRNSLFMLGPVVLVCLLACLCNRPAMAGDTAVRFLGVLDGDSLRVRYRGDILEVRLIGVDAPEYRQEYSRKAREFSQRFCQGGSLRLEFDSERRDRYGRTLAYVHTDQGMLNEELVRAGLAIPLEIRPNIRYRTLFREAEEEARRERRGFWIKGGLDMTPAQWRRKHPRK